MDNFTQFTNIAFRARRKDNGEWVVGNWHHNFRKGQFTAICEFYSNDNYECYRESLQIRNRYGFWIDVENILFEGPTNNEEAKPENLD